MNAIEFRLREFGNGDNQEAIALVAGFDGKIQDFEHTARALVATGRDVIAYEYDNDVLLAGDATLLPTIAEDISKDFMSRTNHHQARRFAGASLGGGIALEMQRRCPNAKSGIYAATGADIAHLVMSNTIFRGVVRYYHKIDPRKEFEKNGYTMHDLDEAWGHLHALPETGFAIALGGLDYAIRQREVLPKLRNWANEVEIKLIVKRQLGHTGIIKWFSHNTPTMLQLTPDYNHQY